MLKHKNFKADRVMRGNEPEHGMVIRYEYVPNVEVQKNNPRRNPDGAGQSLEDNGLKSSVAS